MIKQKEKVAVIGAGITGLLAAYMIVKRGFPVTVFDRQPFPPLNASSIAGGMLAPYSEIENMPYAYAEAGLSGINIWKEILADKPDVFFRQEGSLIVAHRDDQYMIERFAQHLDSAGEPWEHVGKDTIETLEPDLHRFQQGIYLPREAHIHPLQAMEALGECLKKKGMEILQQDIMPQGLLNDFDRVVDCRGYAAEAQDPDLRGIKGEIILIRAENFRLLRPVRLMHPRYPLYIIPRPDNVFAVGATAIESAGDDQLVCVRSALELLSAVYSLNDNLAYARVLSLSSGIRPAYPDNLPRIKISEEGRYIQCNGLFRHGYLLSPVIGKCVAHYLETGEQDEFFPLFSGRFNHALR